MDRRVNPWAWWKPYTIPWNMLFCALVFWPAGVHPRETLSGLFGRKAWFEGRPGFWRMGARFIDLLHPHEPLHCFVTAAQEKEMRKALYGC